MMKNQQEGRVARPRRKPDPQRRERIIEAAIKVVATEGVAACTHRRVALLADVPLGSTTYYFNGIEELLEEVFRRLMTSVLDRVEAQLAQADTPEAVCERLAGLLSDGLWESATSMNVNFELYGYAARTPSAKALIKDWTLRTNALMSRHFAPATARALDVIIEGVTIQNAMNQGHLPRDEVRRLVFIVAGLKLSC